MSTSIESLKRRADAVSKVKRPSEVVYFTATVGMLNDPLYDRALRVVQHLHPGGEILSAKTLWSSADHWRTTYKDVLFRVTDVYILPYTGSIVGVGIFEEICFLDDRPHGAPLASFFDRSLNLKCLHGFITLPDPTAGRFARMCSESDASHLGILTRRERAFRSAERR